MGTTLSKLFGNGSKRNNGGAEPGAGQSATLPRPTTSKVKVDVPKKSSSFRLPFPKKSKTPSPAVTPTIPPKNQDNAPALPSTPPPALNVIDVQIDEEAFKKSTIVETTVEKVSEAVTVVKTELESVVEEVKNEAEGEVENAVVKIQAGVRGFLTRKHMKEGSSPDKEIIGVPPVPGFDSDDKRIETPTPSSPLKTTFTVLETAVQQEEHRPEASLEELEILKKVQEINQLLAKDDDDDFLGSVKSKISETADQVLTTVDGLVTEAVGAIAEFVEQSQETVEDAKEKAEEKVEEVKEKAEETVEEVKEKTEEVVEEVKKEIEEVKEEIKEEIVTEKAPIQQQIAEVIDDITIPTQQVPIHVLKSPSIEEEDEEETEKGALSEEAAAIRIQAAFRGYGVRKSLSREPSPGREHADDEARALEEAAASLLKSQPEVAVEEPVVEAVAQPEVDAANSVTQASEEPEEMPLPVEENPIVPVCVQHEDVVDETDNKEALPVDNGNEVLDLNTEEFEQLETLVSENIIAESSVGESVPAPEVEVVGDLEPVQES